MQIFEEFEQCDKISAVSYYLETFINEIENYPKTESIKISFFVPFGGNNLIIKLKQGR